MTYTSHGTLRNFLYESLCIEGIFRPAMSEEIEATEVFLGASLTVASVIALQEVYAPGKPLRSRPGMDVRVGRHVPPRGFPGMGQALEKVLTIADPWTCHVEFEKLHPFMDGNGRTGRAVWVHKMIAARRNPYGLPFLQRFYYDTLAHYEQ